MTTNCAKAALAETAYAGAPSAIRASANGRSLVAPDWKRVVFVMAFVSVVPTDMVATTISFAAEVPMWMADVEKDHKC